MRPLTKLSAPDPPVITGLACSSSRRRRLSSHDPMALALVPLRLRFSMPGTAHPGHYLGSAWRGAFGHALKKLVCLFSQGHCENCPVKKTCAYTTVFESKWIFDPKAASGGVPAPYTMFPALEDGKMSLYMTVIGSRALGFLPFILQALRQAGASRVAQIPFTLATNEYFNGTQWQKLQLPAESLVQIPECQPGAMSLQLLTPARFKYQGHFITPKTLNLEHWITALRRRLISLASFWGEENSMRALCEVSTVGQWQATDCRWQEMERYSSRQKTAMKIGGVMGNFTLTNEQAQGIWSLLWLGQWVHIGKLATMGLGRYALTSTNQGEAG